MAHDRAVASAPDLEVREVEASHELTTMTADDEFAPSSTSTIIEGGVEGGDEAGVAGGVGRSAKGGVGRSAKGLVEARSDGHREAYRVGDIIEETYEIRGRLGEGAMGEVYEGFDRRLNRRVAIKVAWEASAGALLAKEAQALAAVRHPSMVSVYALGTDRGVSPPRPFVVMERLYGVSLESHLARRRRLDDPLSVAEALGLLISLADGLAATHRAGIVHRDVKPANVMIAPGDRLVLMDFGLFLPANAPEMSDATSGSPAYMAPETILGQAQPGIGFSVDIYALGVIAYELLAGKLPFDSNTIVGVFGQHLTAPVPTLHAARPDTPEALVQLIERMLAKSASDRPLSMEEVVQELRAIRTASTIGAAPSERFCVLVVDDDPDLANLLRAIVKSAVPDAEVRAVADGEKAIEVARHWPPHLMLLDVMMPKMSGVEVCMYMRGAHIADRCFIVSVSAGAQDHDIQLLHQLGITRFLRKGTELVRELPRTVREIHALCRANAPRSSRAPSRASSP